MTPHCASCHKILEEAPGDEEAAQQEAMENFGSFDPRTFSKVCTACYEKIMGWIAEGGMAK